MLAGAAAIAGALAGCAGVPVAPAAAVTPVAAWFGRHRPGVLLVVAVLLGGLASGAASRQRDRPPVGAVPTGAVTLLGVARSDVTGAPGDRWLVVEPAAIRVGEAWAAWNGPPLFVRGDAPGVAAGEPVTVSGRLRPAAFRVRTGWVGAVMERVEVDRLGEAANPLLRIGNRLRRRVLGVMAGVAASPEGALVSGFLIGEVGGLPSADAEALRRAGLSHYVAVSGSNVALFLGAWWLVSGPLSWSPRRRALVGLVGLAVFVVVTRWEASVLRAAVMAGIVLGGRLRGAVIGPWPALGWAVTGLVLIDGGLAASVGFQLSVAATAGILLGIPLWRERTPGWLWATLGATASAQAAVAPILLLHFGAVPLLAPITNLVAAPLVVTSTALGGVGAVLGSSRLVGLAAGVAGLVLRLARAAADLPQLGVAAVVLMAAVGVAAAAWAALRPLVAVAAVVVVAVSLVPGGPPAGPAVAFLDVGQGDAALLRGPAGEVILVDGGPDPAVLRGHLRQAGVTHVDLLIVSHVHADHTAGLVDLRVPVRRVWHPPQEGEGGPFDTVLAEQAGRGAVVEVPRVGTVAQVGAFTLRVMGPLRRYASPNDGSLVFTAEAAGVTVLFSGDIEAIAQADLGPLPADVLKVPHQGAATSDLAWLEAGAPGIAVISVGRNDFGHPSPEVIAVLEAAGAVVRRTDRDGTVELRLDHLAASRSPLPSAG